MSPDNHPPPAPRPPTPITVQQHVVHTGPKVGLQLCRGTPSVRRHWPKRNRSSQLGDGDRRRSMSVAAAGGGWCSHGPRRTVALSVGALTLGTVLLFGAPRPQHLPKQAEEALRHPHFLRSTVDVALALLALQVGRPPGTPHTHTHTPRHTHAWDHIRHIFYACGCAWGAGGWAPHRTSSALGATPGTWPLPVNAGARECRPRHDDSTACERPTNPCVSRPLWLCFWPRWWWW
jgi:hypothetical protein